MASDFNREDPCSASAPSERQRDLFPLPLLRVEASCGDDLSRKVRQRVHRRVHWTRWANQGIEALNQLAGRGRGVEGGARNSTQFSCMERISKAYREMSMTPVEFTCDEALSELLASSCCYGESSSAVVSYSRDLVS